MTAQVIVSNDIDYLPNEVYENDKDLLDIYMPEGRTNVPVIVYFHGGALLKGEKEHGKEIGYRMAKKGIGFVSANYRLSPAFQHPAHVEDAAAATNWVFANIKEYGGNPNQVYLAGHSSGAYLAALLALDTTYEQINSEIIGSILISPFLYVEETAKDRIAQNDIYKTIWGAMPEEWANASVTPHIKASNPYMLLIYADGDADWRKDQNNRFAKAMKQIGNKKISVKEVPNRDHTTLISKISEEDDKIVRSIMNFIFSF